MYLLEIKKGVTSIEVAPEKRKLLLLPHNLSTNKDYSPYSSAEFVFLPNSN